MQVLSTHVLKGVINLAADLALSVIADTDGTWLGYAFKTRGCRDQRYRFRIDMNAGPKFDPDFRPTSSRRYSWMSLVGLGRVKTALAMLPLAAGPSDVSGHDGGDQRLDQSAVSSRSGLQ